MNKKHFYKEYLNIVVPLMFQGIITTLVAMVDNLMVGQLGDYAISAVNVSSRILGILMFTMLGLVAAAGVFIAQYYGAQNREKQQEVFRISIVLSSMLFLLTAVIMMFWHHDVVRFFIQNEHIEVLATDYILWMLLSFIPYTLTLNYGAALKVVGQVKLPLFASLSGVAVNTLFNYLLIFGNFGMPALGVSGAAIATIIARCVEFFIIYTMVKYQAYDFDTKIRELCHFSKALLVKVIKSALPLASNEVIWAVGMAMILKIYGTRGPEVLAGYAIADATLAIFFSLSQGLAAATPVFVSQRLGANKFDEAYANAKEMIRTVIFVAVILGCVMYGTSYIVPNLYSVSNLSHQLAQQMIQIMGMMYWVYIITVQIYFILRAGGDMRSTLYMDGFFMWCITIPALAAVAYLTDQPIFIVYLVGQACDLLKLAFGFRLFLKKGWLKNLTAAKS